MNGEQNHWERQKQEIEAYNLFYSAFQGTRGGKDLTELGYVSPVRFPEIPIRGRDHDAEPDFLTYNNSSLLLVEVKSGKNISQRVKRQMERCGAVSIEDGEEYLRDSDYFQRLGLVHTDVTSIDPCIIFLADKYQQHITVHNSQLLSDISSHSAILTQSRGGQLSIEQGQFDSEEVHSYLESGLPLPTVPPKTVYLNEEVEKESLAVSICHDIAIPDLKNGDVRLKITDIDDLYPDRAIATQDVIDVFDFLEQEGVCAEAGPNEYVFQQESQREIFNIIDLVDEKRVDVHLNKSSDPQSSLDEFD